MAPYLNRSHTYIARMPREETHTPLYYAAINGHTDAMELLFELGADLVKYDEGADTVLRL